MLDETDSIGDKDATSNRSDHRSGNNDSNDKSRVSHPVPAASANALDIIVLENGAGKGSINADTNTNVNSNGNGNGNGCGTVFCFKWSALAVFFVGTVGMSVVDKKVTLAAPLYPYTQTQASGLAGLLVYFPVVIIGYWSGIIKRKQVFVLTLAFTLTFKFCTCARLQSTIQVLRSIARHNLSL